MSYKSISAIFAVLLVFFTVAAEAAAFSLEGIQVGSGNSVILSAEPVADSPAPGAAAPMLGVSVPMMFTPILYFEPGLRFYSTSVVLDSGYKPVPAAVETANRISILNCELRPEIGARFDITDSIRLGVTGAPVFTFRIPVTAHDAAADTDSKTVVRDYFFSKARFLGLYAGGFFNWKFTGNTALVLKLGTNLPVFHFWDGEDISFYDQLMIQPEIGILFSF